MKSTVHDLDKERRGKTKYLVKWKGYTAEENTWEGLENLKNAIEKVEEFEKERFKEEIWRIRMKKEKEIKLNLEAEEFRREELPGRYIQQSCYMDGMTRSLIKNI